MVERVPGPFEYFEVTGASIAASADEPMRHAATLRSLADDLDLDARQVRGAVEGDVEDLVASNPEIGGRSARTLSRKALFASGCVLDFARCVDRFDESVAALNTEYAETVQSADSALGVLYLDPAGGADRFLAGERQRLMPRYRAAEGALDDDAERVAATLDRGVEDRAVRRLVREGLIPLQDATAFDQVRLTESDRLLALAALVAHGRVPLEAMDDPNQLDAYLVEHHDVADAIASADASVLALLLPLAVRPRPGAAVSALGDMSLAERRRLAMLLPRLLGNEPAAPFALRAQANRTLISAQIARDRDRIAKLERANRDGTRYGRAGAAEMTDRAREIERLRNRQKLYSKFLTDKPARDLDGRAPVHRQIILFDPRGDGRIAELHGVLDEHTRNVAVSVPGTTADLDSWHGTARRGSEFVRWSHDLAVVSWMGGDLPDSIIRDAPHQNYARTLGPVLAEFSHEIRAETERAGAPGARTTYVGHSYGAAVVGQAEHVGLDADRVLMVEGAGMGPDVHDPSDLARRNRATQHFSMTAPGDPIAMAQASGHLGADPDDFGDVIRLRTGRFDSGEPIHGLGSHTSVFAREGDAWRNMMAVVNGSTAERWHGPRHVFNGRGYAVVDSPDSGGEVLVR